jgi:hypothetical protein
MLLTVSFFSILFLRGMCSYLSIFVKTFFLAVYAFLSLLYAETNILLK